MSEELRENTESHGSRHRSRGLGFVRRGFYPVIAIVLFTLAIAAHFNSYFRWDVIFQRIVCSEHLAGFSNLTRFVSLIGNGHTPHLISMLTALVLLVFRFWREALGLMFATLG